MAVTTKLTDADVADAVRLLDVEGWTKEAVRAEMAARASDGRFGKNTLRRELDAVGHVTRKPPESLPEGPRRRAMLRLRAGHELISVATDEGFDPDTLAYVAREQGVPHRGRGDGYDAVRAAADDWEVRDRAVGRSGVYTSKSSRSATETAEINGVAPVLVRRELVDRATGGLLSALDRAGVSEADAAEAAGLGRRETAKIFSGDHPIPERAAPALWRLARKRAETV